MLGDICSWTSARETDRWGGRRSWVSIHTGYRREMAFTRDKDSLMDDSARCFGRSSDTPMIFWWFDRRWHGDEFARGPFATVLADLCLTQRRQQPNQPPSLMDDTAVVHRRQCKQLGRRRSRSRGFVSFEIDLTLRSTIVAESRNGITVLIKLFERIDLDVRINKSEWGMIQTNLIFSRSFVCCRFRKKFGRSFYQAFKWFFL